MRRVLALADVLSLLAWLVAGSFIYQAALHHPDWSSAIERSWFMVVATLLVFTFAGERVESGGAS